MHRLLPALLLALCCAAPAARAEDGTPPRVASCEDLAQAFFAIAVYKERGQTREAQLAWARTAPGRSPAARDTLARIVGIVYRTHGSPDGLRRGVRANCRVDAEGRVELAMDWLAP